MAFDFDKNKFLLKQKILTVGARYNVLDENGAELCFLKQKIWTLKRHVEVYASESSGGPLMKIAQDHIFSLFTSYSITDNNNQLIGRIRQKFSLFKRIYGIFNNAGEEVATAEQDAVSATLGYSGSSYGRMARDLANFNLMMSGQQIGVFDRKLTVFDRYVMDIYGDVGKALDRRLALALAVILDLGEDR